MLKARGRFKIVMRVSRVTFIWNGTEAINDSAGGGAALTKSF